MFRVLAIFLFSTLPAMLCAQNDEKKKNSTEKKPTKFKVVKLSEPAAFLGKYTHNKDAQKTELLKVDSVQLMHCFNLPSEYKMYRFRFSAFVDGQYYSYSTRGGRLTYEMKEVISRAGTGTQIKISAITGYKKVKRDTVKQEFPDIIIKVIDNTDTSLITYKLKNRIPEPGLYSIKKELPNKVTRLDLMFVDQLLVKCNCDIPSLSTEFRVLAFVLKAYHNGNEMIYATRGSDLTEEMRDALVHAKSGTKFFIEQIQVCTIDGITGYLKPRAFKVIP